MAKAFPNPLLVPVGPNPIGNYIAPFVTKVAAKVVPFIPGTQLLGAPAAQIVGITTLNPSIILPSVADIVNGNILALREEKNRDGFPYVRPTAPIEPGLGKVIKFNNPDGSPSAALDSQAAQEKFNALGYKAPVTPPQGPPRFTRASILNLQTGESLSFQYQTTELDDQNAGSWASIPSPGRNLPFQHWTGGEESITLELHWVAERLDKRDPMEKAEYIKSLRAADGYERSAPRVKLIWGEVFKDSEFVVHSAPFKAKYPDGQQGWRFMTILQNITLIRVSDSNLKKVQNGAFRF